MANQNGRRTDMMHMQKTYAEAEGVSNKHIRENDILGSSLLEQSLKNIGKQDEVLGEAKNDQESDIMCETLSKSKGSSWVNVVSLGANGVTEIISENPEVTQLASLKIVPSKALEHVYNMGLNPNRRENVMEISYTRAQSTVLVDSGKGSFGDLVEWWVNSMVCATCSYFQTVAGPVHLGV
ncbi:hypothetical protein V6N12_032275 [Hibiscus sabdariffa]|uniref:Uncharacterized protein n=1 Tax=Hibiscus sabdariffa TaxID=183260 RepID=A0ABR2CDW3_9ROSI